MERLGGRPPSPWEERFGYSRVVRTGPLIEIGGTTSVSEDGVVLGVSAYDQATEILRKLADELVRVGASLADVVRTRVFVTEIGRCDEVGRAHAEAFREHRPVTTMVEVARLIDERMLVEIELTAWCEESRDDPA